MELNDHSPSISSQKAICEVDTPNLDAVLALVRASLVLLDGRVRRTVHLAGVYFNMSQIENGSARHATKVDPTFRRPDEWS